ncbi:hypothetical protein [Flavobacterium sp. N3904]|uniref:hypothetical protein n=1 Tax=Flavobacterium sp. N3904 TaxID=2986835 RepID=UPI002224AB53|nr:hypothetical protein [Flavobacterium sp. N3904]
MEKLQLFEGCRFYFYFNDKLCGFTFWARIANPRYRCDDISEPLRVFVDAVIEFGKNDTMLDKVLRIHDKQNPDACYVSESFIKSV